AGLPPVPPPRGTGRGFAGGGRPAEEPCVEPRGVERFADATPDLLYSADVLLDAFPDAQLVQVIRDGRDVVAEMLADDGCLGWFRPGLSNLDEVFPNPFLGVEEESERLRWPGAALAVKCALRWRGSVRLSARLRAQTPEDQLHTVRFEDLAADPRQIAREVSEYLQAPLSPGVLAGLVRPGAPTDPNEPERRVGIWRDRLTPRQVVQVERIAGNELARLGYRLTD
ncbi:sulfotransferase, partial [Actinomadura logoneensis]